MTKAKRIWIVFSVVLVLSLATLITAFAETSTSAHISSEVATVFRGKDITFTVEISNGTEVQSILIIPTYDDTAFELVGGSWTITGGLMSDFSISDQDGVIAFKPGISINGQVLTFTLKAKADAVLDT